jgi:hypothetical protein
VAAPVEQETRDQKPETFPKFMQSASVPHLCHKPTNMGKYLCFPFLLLLHSFSFAQQGDKMPIKFESLAFSLGVTRGEHLVVTNKAGEVVLSDGMDRDWRKADPEQTAAMLSGPLIEQASFFNRDTGFVSGYIKGASGTYNLVYHTTNGGKSWNKIDFRQSGWVDDAFHLDNGEAWLSVAGSGFAYTADYGLTWTKLNNPEVRQRFAKIYFNTKREGIIGSLYNLLAVTNDNCRSWTFLPTPLDQKAYTRMHQGSRPEFERVAIYKDYYLVAQEGLVFYSPKDSVKWTWLPAYNDFYTDAENSALYFHTANGAFIRSGDDFQPRHTVRLENAYDAKCRNGKLFVMTPNMSHQLNPDNSGAASLIASTNPALVEPVQFGYSTIGNFGYWKNKIYVEESYNKGWKYLYTLPVPPGEGSLSYVNAKPQRILYRSVNDSLYYFDMSGTLKEVNTVKSIIARFQEAGISKIIFSRGSQGCYHHYEGQAAYQSAASAFLRQKPANSGKNESNGVAQLPESPLSLERHEVLQFTQKLPQLFDGSHRTSIDDLSFSPSDYEQCKKDIRSFQQSVQNGKVEEEGFSFYRNNLDFDRLVSLVDSIRYLSPRQLEAFFTRDANYWSTTTNRIEIQLVNGRNEVLSIRNEYSKAPYFYFPWTVSLNGVNAFSTDMDIHRFLQQVYPGFVYQPGKVMLLHDLVKWLY